MTFPAIWHTGTFLQNGKYTIEKVLKEGGFGLTYLAQDQAGTPVVIKTLNQKVQQRSDFAQCQQDFVNEALRLAKCIHPNIVNIYELIQEDALWCMVMEYVDGFDLANRVEKEGALTEKEALKYIKEMGEAVCLVHQRGFLHRDIKPYNILVRKQQNEAVLIDFGLAREFTPNLTQIHTEYRSTGFAPIEQYDRRALRGAYTDVYGLAATLYAILTGKVPEAAPNRDRSVAKYQEDPLIPPKSLNPEISDSVNDAIIQGLAIEPEDRPQTMLAWLNLLNIELDDKYYLKPIHSEEIPEVLSSEWTSAVGMDYSQLRDLLATGQWQEADQETANVLLKVYGREQEGKFNLEDVKNLPCRDLRTIDQLWKEWSQGRFGFGIQNQIWESVEQNYDAFCDRVGWRLDHNWLPYNRLSFEVTAPEGHLPSWGRRGRLWPAFIKKVANCGL